MTPHKFNITWFDNTTNELCGEISIETDAAEVRKQFGIQPEVYPGDCLEATDAQIQWVYDKIKKQGVDIVIDRRRNTIYVEIEAL